MPVWGTLQSFKRDNQVLLLLYHHGYGGYFRTDAADSLNVKPKAAFVGAGTGDILDFIEGAK